MTDPGLTAQTSDSEPIGFDPQGQGDALPRAVALLRTLGHEARLEILCQLIGTERSVGELTRSIGAAQPAVSQQLMRLRAEGLVGTRRQGKSILYHIAKPEVAQIVAALRDAFCAPKTQNRG